MESEGLWLNEISFKDEVTEMMKQLEEKGHQVTIQWLKSVFSPRRTLLVIDMQNDFITGSLPVPGAEEIVDKVEELTDSDLWYQVNFFNKNQVKVSKSNLIEISVFNCDPMLKKPPYI